MNAQRLEVGASSSSNTPPRRVKLQPGSAVRVLLYGGGKARAGETRSLSLGRGTSSSSGAPPRRQNSCSQAVEQKSRQSLTSSSVRAAGQRCNAASIVSGLRTTSRQIFLLSLSPLTYDFWAQEGLATPVSVPPASAAPPPASSMDCARRSDTRQRTEIATLTTQHVLSGCELSHST